MAEATYTFGESPAPDTSVYAGLFKDGVIPVDESALLGQPDVRNSIFPGLKEESFLTQFLFDVGRKFKTVQSQFWHFEDKELINPVQIGSKAGTPGAGNQVTITMVARADKKVPLKYWDTVWVGGVRGWIEKSTDVTVSAVDGLHSFVITPVDSADDIVTAAQADDYIFWYGTAKADGSAQPGSMISSPVKYSGQTQILGTTFEANGSAAADMTAIVMSEKTGKKYGYVRGVDQAYLRHMIALAHTIIIGQKSVDLADTLHVDGSTPVRTTEGIEKKIENYGHNFVGTDFNYDTMQQINKILDKEMAPDKYLSINGNEFRYAVDNVFFGAGITIGALSYDPFKHTNFQSWGEADPKKRMIDLGIDGVKVGNREIYFRTEPTMYYKGTLGAPGLPYPNKAFLIPATTFTDAKSGELQDIIAIRYKAGDLEDRYLQNSLVDWKKSETGVDKFKWFTRSEFGWMQAKLNWQAQWSLDTSESS